MSTAGIESSKEDYSVESFVNLFTSEIHYTHQNSVDNCECEGWFHEAVDFAQTGKLCLPSLPIFPLSVDAPRWSLSAPTSHIAMALSAY